MIDVYINKIYLEIILPTATGLPTMNKMCPKRQPSTPKFTSTLSIKCHTNTQ